MTAGSRSSGARGLIDKSRLSTRRYVSTETAAEYLGCSPDTVRRMISRGELQGYRAGKRMVRVDMGEVEDLVREIPNARTK